MKLIISLFLSIAVLAVAAEGPSYSDLPLTKIAGKELFDLKKCGDCHLPGAKEYTPINSLRNEAWFGEHIEKESEFVLWEADTPRQKKRVLDAEGMALTHYLFESSDADKMRINDMTEGHYKAAYLMYQQKCMNCHMIAGVGKKSGPDLSFVADEHGDKQWHIENLKNPQKNAPDSMMPQFESLSDEQLGLIADYLLALKSK
jgi:mono/diheme cytochrome c family protein